MRPDLTPIVVARKPLAGTVAANVQAHGTGALNIDGCRVGTPEDKTPAPTRRAESSPWFTTTDAANLGGDDTKGRWPANVVLSHTEDCVELGTKRVKASGYFPAVRGQSFLGQLDGVVPTEGGPRPSGDGDGMETVSSWQCSLDCAVRLLDEQSGKRGAAAPASGPTYSGPSKSGSMAGAFKGMGDQAPAFHGDTGGASRFYYVAKASRADREAGLTGLPTTQPVFNGHNAEPSPSAERGGSVENKFRTSPRQNDHPTVKPHELMRWLCRLVGGQPGSLILDPFAGSGSTLRAAKAEGFDFLGIERDRHYYRLACLRAGLPDPGEGDEMEEAA